MKQPITMIAAAAILAGGLSLPATAQDNDAHNPTQQQQQQLMEQMRNLFPQGAAEFADRDPIEMRVATEQMIDHSLTPGELDEAFTQLSRVNRNKLGDLKDEHVQTLQRELEVFQQAFQEKYDEELKIAEVTLLGDAQTLRVEINQADAIGRLPYHPIRTPAARDTARARQQDQAGDQAQPAAGRQQQYGASAETWKLTDDSSVALLGLPMRSGAPQMIVTAVGEGRPGADAPAEEWRVIVPLQMTANRIAVNIAQQLRDLRERQDNWPENPQHTRELLARRVLMAYYNIEPGEQRNQQQQQQANPRPANPTPTR